MNITIRQETQRDHQPTEDIVKKAFADAEYSDHKEQFLVNKLRNSKVFVPEPSLVGEVDGEIVGHIMFTKLIVENDESNYESLALAPVSVLPADESFMALELKTGSLAGVTGTVVYPQEFFE